MAVVVLQKGHVPRTKGLTGTRREQEFAHRVVDTLAPMLQDVGHTVLVIGADSPIPDSDYFVSFHCDGSLNRDKRGASVGYRDEPGGRAARAWKRRHQAHGYDGGFLPDNYTANLRDYYGVRRSRARYRFIAEHGHLTNPTDEALLFADIEGFARAHFEAIGEVIGHPRTGTPVTAPSPGDTGVKARMARKPELRRRATGHDVAILQGLLVAHAALPMAVDGDFGETTERGLAGWQRRSGVLVADGICGPTTWSHLVPDELVAVGRGSVGGYVKLAQGLMLAHGAVPPDGPMRVDGDFGEVTEGALRAWQQRTGALPVDGVVNPADDWPWLLNLPA